MTGLRLADLRRTARRLETIEALTSRVAKLEAAIAAMAARLEALEAARQLSNRARKDEREGVDGYEIASLIG